MTDVDTIPDIFDTDEPAVDLLGGLPDLTHGEAEVFFDGLTDDEREIIHWYSDQALEPVHALIEHYVVGLAGGVDATDPERSSTDALESAHQEIDRLRKFLQIFIDNPTFFPVQRSFTRTETDDDGTQFPIRVDGWSNMHHHIMEDPTDIKQHTMPMLDSIDAYLDDPESVPHMREAIAVLHKPEQ